MSENLKMMYDVNEAVRRLNEVEGFEPKNYLRKENSENGVSFYLDTKYRLLWFRLKYQHGKIVKLPKALTKDYATFEVRIYADVNDSPENFLANGFASRYRDDSNKEFGLNFVESAETAALGRALKDAGFGTQFCDIALPNDYQVVDAGVNITLDTGEMPFIMDEEEEKSDVSVPLGDADKEIIKETAENTEMKDVEITSDMSIEEIKKRMTLEYAKNVVVTIGYDKGKSLGYLAANKPRSIEFHASRGENNIVKVAAWFLIQESQKAA